MTRQSLSDDDRRLGAALGVEIRRRRGRTSASALASAHDVNLDTWRRVEQGKVANPGFFLVAEIAAALNVTMDELAASARSGARGDEK